MKPTADQLYFESPDDPDNTAVFFANADGGLTVSVSEEVAIDSYNSDIECTVYLSADEARRLRDYLNANFGAVEP